MRWTLALAALAVAPSLAAQANDPDRQVQGSGALPAGWNARADRDRPMTALKFEKMGAGLHFTTGPAVIAWRDADAVTGAVHAEATFTQTKAPEHAEAYGMFIGGKDLKGAATAYVYFIVRGDGKFLVKKMAGTAATNVSTGWTEHAAIVKQDAAGKQTNKLEVSVARDGKVSWKVNGQEVYAMTLAPADAAGVVGLRVNHNLDVHVDGFAVHKM